MPIAASRIPGSALRTKDFLSCTVIRLLLLEKAIAIQPAKIIIIPAHVSRLKLFPHENADVTAYYLLAGEDNYFAFGNDEENKGGTIDINGKLTITPLITESNAETVNISGCIRDLRDNELLIGVSIIEKGTNNGTDSNFDGNFSLKAKKGSTIELHYVGCKPLQFIANSNCTIQAFLEWDDRTLDDPIIIAGVVPQ